MLFNVVLGISSALNTVGRRPFSLFGAFKRLFTTLCCICNSNTVAVIHLMSGGYEPSAGIDLVAQLSSGGISGVLCTALVNK